MRTLFKLGILGLAAYGAHALWNRYGDTLGRGRDDERDADRRIHARAELTVEETAAGSDDPLAQAAAILAESDLRSTLPRTAPGVEHRRSQDTVEP